MLLCKDKQVNVLKVSNRQGGYNRDGPATERVEQLSTRAVSSLV
jgi:hypothetical protein